jgi:hypothetical protein
MSLCNLKRNKKEGRSDNIEKERKTKKCLTRDYIAAAELTMLDDNDYKMN